MIRRLQSAPPPLEATELTTLFQDAARKVYGLAHAIASRQSSKALFDRAEAALAGLPLAADEFSVAIRRLQNAANYQRQGELGAATYELRMLAKALGK